MFGDEFDPCFVSVMIKCMIVREACGVSVVFNKVEVTSHDEVHVVRNVAQEL